MFELGPLSYQQITTLYAIVSFLTVAPFIIGTAAVVGYLNRVSRS